MTAAHRAVILESKAPSPQPAGSSAPAVVDVRDVPDAPALPPAETPDERFTPSPRSRWEWPALLVLLLVTGALYVWDLSASGWANWFYAAAVQAGSVSWRAFLFGASDAAASITVDKPPASLWIMQLSVRVFGLNSWSMLVPQALMGMATVGLVYSSVRRYFSAQAGLIAGTVVALTPVAALMFRFNNPDALLVLLLTGAVVATLRAIENGRTRWMVLAGVLIGFGFLTKQLQAVLVLPGIAAVYLIAAPVSLWRRLRDGLIAIAAMLVSAGWWVAIVELTPATNRPYIGSSTDNSFLSLTFGYNGLGRVVARSTPPTHAGNALGHAATGHAGVRPGGGAASFGAGLPRIFEGGFGGHIAWLIPAALMLGLAGLWIIGRRPRTDVRRAALMIWGATLVVTGLTFSLMSGMLHEYYTVALAPSIGALVGIGAWLLWTRRTQPWALPVLALVSLVTTGWAFAILARSPEWNPWLRWAILAVGIVAAAGLLIGRGLGTTVLRTGVSLALVAALAGPAAWTIDTTLTPHSGGDVKTGPAVVDGASRGPGGFGGRDAFGGQGARPAGHVRAFLHLGPGVGPQLPRQQSPGADAPPRATNSVGPRPPRDAMTASAAVVSLLLKNADSYTWVAATGSETAATYQLATEKSVMPVGGFSGGDPSPTLAQFQAYIAESRIHYYIVGRSGAAGGGGKWISSLIATWVGRHFSAQTIDGVTLYDLTKPKG